tara:strand:+ start:650 stop:847 length:198 start_codon:yes stop_codon:yes gene_type:complete
MNTEIWLLVTAVIFTVVGMFMEHRRATKTTERIIEVTVDRLIKDSYIKTKLCENGQVELLKYYDE